ncbi:HlyC/CorC family transporter [Megasphaera hexanoica]|uniref:HlyC/CorC family transporter n=2 Tax=Megasphaera hexanoica TaxID=1675036 RepID=A0A848BU61_9FIRM|nr:hemolysin family protein [Megasphaera hexanoica]NME28740.1 HlyC/CorC family transporter [Megasphaera hexanoica]
MESELGHIAQYLLLLVPSILLSVFCVIGKFAFVQLRRESIEEMVRDGDTKARFLLKLYEKPAIFLGMAQLGMVISGMASGAVVFYVLYEAFPLLHGWIPLWAVGILYICIILLVCICLWVFGELIPKSIGLQRAEGGLKRVSHFLYSASRLFYPFIIFGNWLGQRLLKNRNLDVTNEIDMAHSEDEIRMLITASHKEGKIDPVESELIGNVFDFADRLAKEIMVPRQEIVCLYVEETMNQHLKTIRQSRHTRYPLCTEDKDHILGLIHIKDFMDLYIHKRSNLRLIKRPILMVPEIMPASQLLQLMRARRTYLATVVDEYGSTVGLIGLEDILEELVGNIRNEHSSEQEEIQPLPNGAYEFDGTVLLEDVEEMLHIPVEEDVDTDTIGGYVFYLLGHTPNVGEEVVIGSYKFSVLEVQGFRIARIKAVPMPPADDTEGEGTDEQKD